VFCSLQGTSKGTSGGGGKPQGRVRPRDGGDVVGGLRCFVGVLKVQTTKQPPKVAKYNHHLFTLQTVIFFFSSLTDVTSERIRPSGCHISPGAVTLCNQWSLAGTAQPEVGICPV